MLLCVMPSASHIALCAGSGLSSALLGVPDSADPGTTSDGVQAAEVIAGVTDSPVFVGGGERRRA
jgi:hypothetical protein